MVMEPIAMRYAEAVFDTAKREAALDAALEQLTLIGELIRREPTLKELLFNPGMDPQDKLGVFERTLQGSWSPLVRASVAMVISMGRAEALPEIVEAFAALVARDRKQITVLVRSARPLAPATLTRLQTTLERREALHVQLHAEVDPALIGGIQVRLDHRVIDGSVRRQLSELRDRLTSVRVN